MHENKLTNSHKYAHISALVDKTPVAAKILIANRALNAQQYEGVGRREAPRQQSVNEVSAISEIQSQLTNLTSLVSQVVIGPKIQENQVCAVCSIQGHPSDKCPQLIENGGWESANAIGFQGQNQTKYDPYSNTYNPGWRDHPNFKWREPQQPAQQGGFRQNPPGFYTKPYAPQQAPQPSASSQSGTSLGNDQAMQLLTSISQGLQKQDNRIANNEKEMMDIKKQMGQISEFLGQIREQGRLPSSTNVNPKGGFESAKAITLRSGKEVGIESDIPKSAQEEDEKLQQEEGSASTPTTRVKQPLPQAPIEPKSAKQGNLVSKLISSTPNLPNVPFPRRFMQSKKEESEKDILETFRKVQVNIPLLDAIKQVPKYAKFLKELCTTKKRMSNKEVVKVSENVSAVLQRKLPTKCKDPGSFTIPCVIGNTRFEHAMLDLGASINVMPYSIYASMNLGELKNDGVIIQLADRSNAYPKGVVEDVLVQVDHLIFPADFYVLEMEDAAYSSPMPLLLGRPFMKTAQTKIDVAKGTLSMKFGNDKIKFNVSKPVETINAIRSCFAIIKPKGQECLVLSTNDASRALKDEEVGVKHEDHVATALKITKLAVGTKGKKVESDATSSHRKGKPSNPNPIPLKIKRWFPSLLQVPHQIPDGERIHLDFRRYNAPITKIHHPIPFVDPTYEEFEESALEAAPLYAVGPNGV